MITKETNAGPNELSEIAARVNARNVDKLRAENDSLRAQVRALEGALQEAADYLEHFPETAAGGDDEAVKLAAKCRHALAQSKGAA